MGNDNIFLDNEIKNVDVETIELSPNSGEGVEMVPGEAKKKISLEELEKMVYELEEALNRLSKFSEPSDELVDSINEYITILYRNAIAIICDIEVEKITDEMIEIARTTRIPISGREVDENGNYISWDGARPLNDDELRNKLGVYYEEKAPSRMEILANKENDIYTELRAKNVSPAIFESVEKMVKDLYRKTIAEISGCAVNLVTDEALEFIRGGDKITTVDDDKNLVASQRHFDDIEVSEIMRTYLLTGKLEKSYIIYNNGVQVPSNVDELNTNKPFKM